MPVALANDDISPLDAVQEALQTVRTHFGMEVAYLSEVVGDEWVVRACDAPGLEGLIQPGDRRPLESVYCAKVAAGDLPELIPDTADVALAQQIPTTKEVPIGAHISVPITRRDGSHFGNFCCLSPTPNPTLNARDLDMMRIFARLAQREVQAALETRAIAEAVMTRISKVIEDQSFSMVFQPMYDLAAHRIVGFEALCRFQGEPYRAPDQWFAEADEVGLGKDLEFAVLEATLDALRAIPPDLYLSVNAGPDLAMSGRLAKIFAQVDARRLVLEVTEHSQIHDFEAMNWALTQLRNLGARIAVDDTGIGYSGLQQMLRLQPELIKLDRSLVTDIHNDAARRALCAALVHYSRETGSTLVAEGIEQEAEAKVLAEIGAQIGQGWLFGKPLPLDEALQAAGLCYCQRPRSA